MAAATYSLRAVVQDVFQVIENLQRLPSAVATPINSNQAQGAPAPTDIVTLSNQAAQGQQTSRDPNHGRFDRAAFLRAAGAYFGGNAPRFSRQSPPRPIAFPLAQTQDTPAAAATAANTAANASPTSAADPAANDAATTPKQELQELDQTLQQLGIDPQSISIFNRMAMLFYANDPAALRLLVLTLQAAAQQGGRPAAGMSTTSSTPPASTSSIQIGDLQVAFQAGGIQPGARHTITSGAPNAAGSTLNVTA